MGRILAIDYGTKRTGLAWTDPLKLIASGLESLDTHQLEDRITNLLKEEDIELIVLGYPTKLDGSPTDSTAAIEAFFSWLKKNFPQQSVELWDEKFSSKNAMEVMVKAGVPKKKRGDKYLINQVSATLILQDYMANH